jgi:hypothetical protein
MKGADTGIFPTKGKGWGVQGEAAFPDLIQHWNQENKWQSWRRGMALAFSADRPLLDGLTVLSANGMPAGADLIVSQDAIKVDFPSRDSPQGAWSVVIRPRGVQQAALAIGDDQFEVWWTNPATEEQARVMAWRGNWSTAETVLASALIGELIEDTATPSGELLDVLDGHALLCVGMDTDEGIVYFDAERLWRYEPLPQGGRVLVEHAVPRSAPLPKFRADRSLVQSMTMSCNCPSHLGSEYAFLGRQLRPGTQGAFPQRGGQTLQPLEKPVSETTAGVKRAFSALSIERIPGEECKHIGAVRFLLRSPLREPTDNPVVWRGDPDAYGQEEIWGREFDRRLAEELEAALSVASRWEGVDITLLAASAGDAFSVWPTRQRLDGLPAPARMSALQHGMRRDMDERAQLFPEQHFGTTPLASLDSIAGDWWVGRGTSTVALIYTSPTTTDPTPAIQRMPMGRFDFSRYRLP